MIGAWVHWPRIFWLLGAIGMIVVTLAAVAMVAARQQSAQNAAAMPPAPVEPISEKPSAEMEEAVRKPIMLKPDVEQTRLPPNPWVPDANLQNQITALQEAQARDAAELKRLRDELAQKAKPAPTHPPKVVDPEAQRKAQEAKEAARAREAEIKARRTSSMSFFRDDAETKENGLVSRKRPPYAHFLSAGSVVNCTIENGINTEHQVPVIGRISSPVYDSVTGVEAEALQDAVLIGEYTAVLLGDETVTVSWNTLVYRDGSEADLQGQPGGNALGQAGLPAEIDNKWGTSLFALATSSVQRASTVGVSLMGQTPAERVVAGAASGALQETGQKFQRTMNVAPSGHVAPGTPCSMNLKSALDLTEAPRP